MFAVLKYETDARRINEIISRPVRCSNVSGPFCDHVFVVVHATERNFRLIVRWWYDETFLKIEQQRNSLAPSFAESVTAEPQLPLECRHHCTNRRVLRWIVKRNPQLDENDSTRIWAALLLLDFQWRRHEAHYRWLASICPHRKQNLTFRIFFHQFSMQITSILVCKWSVENSPLRRCEWIFRHFELC